MAFYDGVESVIPALREISLLIYTNKHHHQAIESVQQLSGEDVFETLGLLPGQPGKPDTTRIVAALHRNGLKPEETAFIGDAPFDMIVAKKTGDVRHSCRLGLSSRRGADSGRG